MSKIEERSDYRDLTFDWTVECLHKELFINGGFTFRVKSGLRWGAVTTYSLYRPLNGYAVSVDKNWEVKSSSRYLKSIRDYLTAALVSRLGDDSDLA